MLAPILKTIMDLEALTAPILPRPLVLVSFNYSISVVHVGVGDIVGIVSVELVMAGLST